MSSPTARPRRRADAERNVARILDAAIDLLASRPDASMSQVAAAAGVSRQTVYGHFASREALLEAVAERALAETLAAIDGSDPERGPPAEALARLTDAWWSAVVRHAEVLGALAAAYPDRGDVHALHAPIRARIEALARRGQDSGAFAADSAPGWLAAAFVGLMHAAADEVAAGRLARPDAGRQLAVSVPRLFGAAAPGPAGRSGAACP
ncbi:MAG: TetR/AcrR family transcriptional regulator [Solirubrobacterales bacterium]|nr:TetR/AcrR family transcriptional regulator [Solirubrobacterales bacterium]